jgi:hypothetical protein
MTKKTIKTPAKKTTKTVRKILKPAVKSKVKGIKAAVKKVKPKLTKKTSKAFETIKAGLDDAIAYARGDKSRGKMTKISTSPKKAKEEVKAVSFKGWTYEIEADSNYPDSSNLVFNKPGNVAFTKDETEAITNLVKKMTLDPDPIMEGMYAFDGLIKEMVVRELLLAGLTEYVETNPYVPDFSEPVEPTDPNDPNAGGCSGSCGGGCGGGGCGSSGVGGSK